MSIKKKIYLFLLIITGLVYIILPEITGNNNIQTRIFVIIPFTFFALFISSSDEKNN